MIISLVSLKDGVPRLVVDVAAGGNTDAAPLRGEGVGDIVAVEVKCRHNAVRLGVPQTLLQEGVADPVFND